ncbi:MAG TPA: hypothetical protein VNA20_18460 [Frankiaceae bacterium]|nr:hypothetical protein [Frankiaceae bacterium]
MGRAFSRCVAGAAFLTLTMTGGPALADESDPVGIVGDLVGLYPLLLEKGDANNYGAGGGGLVGVPPLSVNELDDVEALAGTALGAAGKVCLPYTVHGRTNAVDEFENTMIQDYVRFRVLWCEDEFRAVQPGEGTCMGSVSVIYRVGVRRCWWQYGITGGSTMSFRSGGDYHVTLGVGTISTPVKYASVRVDFTGGWQPGSPLPDCPEPVVPRGWRAWCKIALSSNW